MEPPRKPGWCRTWLASIRGPRCSSRSPSSSSGRYAGYGVAGASIIEVIIDFPQACRLQSLTQFAGREGMKADPVLARLEPVTVFEDQDDVGDVLLVQAVRYLPGV